MVNIDQQIVRLRWDLERVGWMIDEIDAIADEASSHVNDAITEIVSSALEEAVDYGSSIGADEFVGDLAIVDVAGSFTITTHSGNTNYNVPERKNLPFLLGNAKTAKDGSKYKVIPIKEKATHKEPPSMDEAAAGQGQERPKPQQVTNIYDVLRQRQDRIDSARETLRERQYGKNQSARTSEMMERFNNILMRTGTAKIQARTQEHITGENFRTASSKQDPNESWVVPERDLDLTTYLMNLNHRMQSSIAETVDAILNNFIEEFS